MKTIEVVLNQIINVDPVYKSLSSTLVRVDLDINQNDLVSPYGTFRWEYKDGKATRKTDEEIKNCIEAQNLRLEARKNSFKQNCDDLTHEHYMMTLQIAQTTDQAKKAALQSELAELTVELLKTYADIKAVIPKTL